MINESVVIILLAGGIGKRFDKNFSKQMITYNNETILEKNVLKFKKHLLNTRVYQVN